ISVVSPAGRCVTACTKLTYSNAASTTSGEFSAAKVKKSTTVGTLMWLPCGTAQTAQSPEGQTTRTWTGDSGRALGLPTGASRTAHPMATRDRAWRIRRIRAGASPRTVVDTYRGPNRPRPGDHGAFGSG